LLTRRHPVWFSDAVESFLLLSDQAGYFSLFAIRVTWSPCLQLSHSAGDERDNARKVPTQKNHLKTMNCMFIPKSFVNAIDGMRERKEFRVQRFAGGPGARRRASCGCDHGAVVRPAKVAL
jgi:hypothetical protein